MRLRSLLAGVDLIGGTLSLDTEIQGLSIDSRTCQPGDLFFVRSGFADDGMRYVSDAVAAGALGCMSDRPVAGVPYLQVSDIRRSLAIMARTFYGRPDEAIPVVGITGTNGKTTITHMIAWALGGDSRCGRMGTVDIYDGRRRVPAGLTTPEAHDVYRYLAAMAANGLHAAVMEVSAHGLTLQRVYGLRFQVGVFTNLSVDHMDFYRDLSSYLDAKLALFRSLGPDAVAVLNADDEAAIQVAGVCRCDIVRVGFGPGCDVQIHQAESRDGGQHVHLSVMGSDVSGWLPMPGRHNAMNLAQAIAVGVRLGTPADTLMARMHHFPGVPGRMERVPSHDGVHYFVDFAHTPDGLAQVLRALKADSPGRLICVFGCGGDRDRTKRPLMLTTVCRYADRVIATADNPRTEPLSRIFDDMRAGETGGRRVDWIEDRREAIRMAVAAAREGDTVLVAGKGHEAYQLVGNRKIPFSDREEILQALEAEDGHADA